MLLTAPPVERLVALAQRAEAAGFSYVWLNDAPPHYADPWPVFAVVARETTRIRIGPMVTNPATRDWACLASMLSTLDEISGGRMVCGIGRGDLAVRVLGSAASSVDEFRRFATTLDDLVGGREVEHRGVPVRLAWAPGRALELWGAAYGPRALAAVAGTCNGCIVQAGDPRLVRWTAGLVRDAAVAEGRGPDEVRLMAAAPAYVSDDLDRACREVAWFSGVAGRHLAGVAARYADRFPEELRALAVTPPTEEHGLGHDAPPDLPAELHARFSLVGPPEAHRRRLDELRDAGTSAFSAYLSHDAAEETIDRYGREVIPSFQAAAA